MSLDTVENIVAGVLALAILVYLLFSLLHPERSDV
ncbi:K(+)-transporting ATPase subunit F [Microlunatus sp. Y2014]